MPLFIWIGRDGPRGAELRPDQRPGHLANLEPLAEAGRIRFAGPLKREDGSPCGSVIVFEAPDLAAARDVAERDAYTTSGVFESVEVFESLQVFPSE